MLTSIQDDTDVIARLMLPEAGLNTVEFRLLHDLAEGCEHLAFAVIDARERELELLGLYLDFDSGAAQLKLGTDFEGVIITESCTKMSFKVIAPAG